MTPNTAADPSLFRNCFGSKKDLLQISIFFDPKSQNGLPRDPQMETKIVKFHQNVVLETTPQAGIKNNTQKVRFWSLLGRVERGSSA